MTLYKYKVMYDIVRYIYALHLHHAHCTVFSEGSEVTLNECSC